MKIPTAKNRQLVFLATVLSRRWMLKDKDSLIAGQRVSEFNRMRSCSLKTDIFTAIHQFEEPGWFIGIVTATHPELNKTYTAMFPFEVGFSGFGYLPLFVALITFLQIYYLFTTGQLTRWKDKWKSLKQLEH